MLTEIEYHPLDVFRRLERLPFAAFLDSARIHPEHGRLSLFAADPQLIVRTDCGRCVICNRRGRVADGNDPWELLDALLSRFRQPAFSLRAGALELPMGAAIGFLGYDAGRWLEPAHPLPAPHPAPLTAPEMWFGFYDVVLAFDHVEKRGWLVSSGMDDGGVASDAQARFRTDQFLDELQSDIAFFPSAGSRPETIRALRAQSDHEEAVRQAIGYIRRGDIYQVNLAHAFLATTSERPQELYLRLRRANPAPFGAYLNFDDGQILSSSPERFLRMDRRKLQTRPIKGTCPRVGIPQTDWEQANALLASAKNRAELIMITDLLRNDLGRVAEYGSVSVPDLVRLEEYETVYHLVSTVEAALRPHALHLDAVAACFPGGSITGAPKLRAMEIIHELEPCGRGVYTGALGYIGFNGISDFNILIRTLVHREGQVCFHVGGGIVADSEPRLEYEETMHKARGLLWLWNDPARESAPQSAAANTRR